MCADDVTKYWRPMYLYVVKKMTLIYTCFSFSHLTLPGSEALPASSKMREMVDRLEVLLLQIIKIKCFPFIDSRLVFVLAWLASQMDQQASAMWSTYGSKATLLGFKIRIEENGKDNWMEIQIFLYTVFLLFQLQSIICII